MVVILAEDNFKCIFLNENDKIPIQISPKFVLRSPIDNKSGNGSTPKRRQFITWTNADPVHWRIYATLGGDELKPVYTLEKNWHNYNFRNMSHIVPDRVRNQSRFSTFREKTHMVRFWEGNCMLMDDFVLNPVLEWVCHISERLWVTARCAGVAKMAVTSLQTFTKTTLCFEWLYVSCRENIFIFKRNIWLVWRLFNCRAIGIRRGVLTDMWWKKITYVTKFNKCTYTPHTSTGKCKFPIMYTM